MNPHPNRTTPKNMLQVDVTMPDANSIHIKTRTIIDKMGMNLFTSAYFPAPYRTAKEINMPVTNSKPTPNASQATINNITGINKAIINLFMMKN